MTSKTETTNPVFTDLKCSKVSFLIKIKLYTILAFSCIFWLQTKKFSLSKKNLTKSISLKFLVDSLNKSLWNHLTNQSQNKQTGLWVQTWQSIVKSTYAIDFESLTSETSIIVSPYWSVLDFCEIESKKSSWRNLIFCLFRTFCCLCSLQN